MSYCYLLRFVKQQQVTVFTFPLTCKLLKQHGRGHVLAVCSRLVLLLSQAHLLTFFLVNVIMLESVASKFYNSATFLLRGLT